MFAAIDLDTLSRLPLFLSLCDLRFSEVHIVYRSVLAGTRRYLFILSVWSGFCVFHFESMNLWYRSSNSARIQQYEKLRTVVDTAAGILNWAKKARDLFPRLDLSSTTKVISQLMIATTILSCIPFLTHNTHLPLKNTYLRLISFVEICLCKYRVCLESPGRRCLLVCLVRLLFIPLKINVSDSLVFRILVYTNLTMIVFSNF